MELLSTLKEHLANLSSLQPPASKSLGVAVDFTHSNLFALELQTKKGKTHLVHFATEPFPDDKGNLDGVIRALIDKQKFSDAPINIALSGSVVLVRFIEYPKMKLDELKNSMRFEIEKYIPFQSDDVIADFHILGDSETKKMMKVILVAAKKTELLSLIESFQKTNLKIGVIDIHALACFNAFISAKPEVKGETVLLVDVGRETSSLLILEGESPAFIREIAIGNEDILAQFQKKLTEDSPEAAGGSFEDNLLEYPEVFTQSLEPFISQLRLSLNYFANHHPGITPPQATFLSGNLCQFRPFQEALSESLNIEAALWDCFKDIELSVPASQIEAYRPMLSACMGLAMREQL